MENTEWEIGLNTKFMIVPKKLDVKGKIMLCGKHIEKITSLKRNKTLNRNSKESSDDNRKNYVVTNETWKYQSIKMLCTSGLTL